MKYINIKSVYGVETIDEFETIKEAIKMLKEYQLSNTYSNLYISQRHDKTWHK